MLLSRAVTAVCQAGFSTGCLRVHMNTLASKIQQKLPENMAAAAGARCLPLHSRLSVGLSLALQLVQLIV